MLVLARRKNESFTITTPSGEVLKIVVVGWQRDEYGYVARIGIDAPREFLIERDDMKKGKPND